MGKGDIIMEAAIKYTRDEINYEIPFPVIVENWEKRLTGKGKRAYHETFTPKERKSIGMYYPRFYKWYLVKGVPKDCIFLLRNIELLKRAGNFFACI